jgi:hypothetical protein
MGMLSRWLDSITYRQFAKDASGHMVFFPRGRRHFCYYVDAADETRLRSLVRMYAIGGALINFTGSMASLGFTEALAFDHGHALPERMKFVLIVFLICVALFSVGPALILWIVYRDAVNGVCGPLAVVDPSSLRLVPTNWSTIRIWVALFAGALILLGLAVILLMTRHAA